MATCASKSNIYGCVVIRTSHNFHQLCCKGEKIFVHGYIILISLAPNLLWTTNQVHNSFFFFHLIISPFIVHDLCFQKNYN